MLAACSTTATRPAAVPAPPQPASSQAFLRTSLATSSSYAPNRVGHRQQLTARRTLTPLCAAAIGERTLETVADVMTTGKVVMTCTPYTTIDEALELLVQNHVTGLPVVNEEGTVVGVVSDFDLLALEGIGTKEKSEGLFPEANSEWDTFFEVQRLIQKNAGKIVGDVMTADPITVRPFTSIEDAANLLLRMKIRRLPVVDEKGQLLGIISRGNIIKAALEHRKAMKGNQ